jgi:hypothetical protein
MVRKIVQDKKTIQGEKEMWHGFILQRHFCFISLFHLISFFGSVRFGSVRFGSVRFGSVRFGSVRFITVVRSTYLLVGLQLELAMDQHHQMNQYVI